MLELPNIAAYAYQDPHVWSALLTCMRPMTGVPGAVSDFPRLAPSWGPFGEDFAGRHGLAQNLRFSFEPR